MTILQGIRCRKCNASERHLYLERDLDTGWEVVCFICGHREAPYRVKVEVKQ